MIKYKIDEKSSNAGEALLNKESRDITFEDENLFKIIIDFPKHADETSPVARGCYCKVLEQVIIMSDYDYLSKIKDGRTFLKIFK